MAGYIGGDIHERLDRYAVKYLGRPDREQRFENRSRMLPQAIEGAALGASLMVGTGRVRLGQIAMKTGHRRIITAAKPLRDSLAGWWPRTAGKQATKAVPEILAGARQIEMGSRMVRQGRFLQFAGLAGVWRL
jgi:hypothetical protein